MTGEIRTKVLLSLEVHVSENTHCRGSINLHLVSYLTSLDSAVSVPKSINIFSCFVKSNSVNLQTSRTAILPPYCDSEYPQQVLLKVFPRVAVQQNRFPYWFRSTVVFKCVQLWPPWKENWSLNRFHFPRGVYVQYYPPPSIPFHCVGCVRKSTFIFIEIERKNTLTSIEQHFILPLNAVPAS